MGLLRGLRAEFRPLMKLGAPLVLGEIGWMMMGIVDTMMLGHYSREAMGASAVAGVLFYTVAIFGMGLMLGLDTLVSQAFGAGRINDCHHSLWAALWLCVPLTPALMGLQWLSLPVMAYFEVHPGVLREARPFLGAIVWSTPFLLLYAAFRRYLQGMNMAKVVMFALISANAINALSNWVFIFGHWGAPRMGVAGSGWATCVSRIYLVAVLIGYAVWRHTGFWLVDWRPDFARMVELVRIGLPAALQIVIELSVFGLATVFAGKLEPQFLAAHQIALQAASMTFMVPLGLGSAAAVRVGQAMGRGDLPGASRAGWAAIGTGVAFMGVAGLCFLAMPRPIAHLFTNDQTVIDAAVPLLAWVAVFQLFDGAQGVATGALRGAGSTRIAAFAHLFGYWVIGMPLSYYLCFTLGWGTVGLWVGLSLALILIGVSLLAAWAKEI